MLRSVFVIVAGLILGAAWLFMCAVELTFRR